MVYTAPDGKEYALNPKGLKEVKTTEGAADYKSLTCGADNEVIPNNASRNWQGETSFNFVIADKEGDGTQVVATNYGFRKSRANSYADGEYLTMDENVWTSSDNGTATYVLTPTTRIREEVDWDKPTSYKLSVSRNGETHWLGVAENARLTVAYKVAEKNSYLGGCLTTDIKKEIKATVEPCETKAEEDDGEASAREPKDKSEEPPPDSVAAGAE
jgi:hypothetical protein